MPKKDPKDPYGIGEHKEENWKALLRFVRMARKEYSKKDFESLKVTLNQIIGRCKNLLLELEGKAKL